tara:strand:+ start:83 stop:550 length:468 start_codon:yes stop_codon:yes gene_type:complete
MVKIKLREKSRDEPLILRRGGVTYSITSTEEVDMPLAYAAYVVGDAITYRFDASDKSDLLAAKNDLERVVLMLENAPSLDAVVTKHFPKKLSSVKAKPKPKPEVKEEPVVEKEEPVVKEEKPAPKKRGRPPKKKTEDASPKPKAKKTKKTTTKEE